MKIKDFLQEKINNFKIFIEGEMKKVDVDDNSKAELREALTVYSKDLNTFAQSILLLVQFDSLDDAVKYFLLNYNIKIEEIQEDIDYEKLKRYLECFLELVKK